jgi:hypothetical protein
MQPFRVLEQMPLGLDIAARPKFGLLAGKILIGYR